MSPLSLTRRSWLPVVAAVVALGVAGYALLRRPPAAPDEPIETVERPTAPQRPTAGMEPPPQPTRGGLFQGIVVDADDRPVSGAEVFLVADAGPQRAILEPEEAGSAVPVEVIVYGNHVTADKETTDAQGRFSASGGDAAAVAIMATHPAHAPGLLTGEGGAPLRPGSDLVVRLPGAGRLEGLVVDADTRQPVRDAQVTIFVQGVANLEAPGGRPFSTTNAFARFQPYVEKVLAPAAWGVEPVAGQSGLNVWTDRDGRFRFGPISNEVQLEVVITHPEYKWEDFDPEVPFPKTVGPQGGEGPPVGRRRRIVVEPGKVVEKTFALHRGNEVTGVVVDEADRPVSGVVVRVEHVVQVWQHPWYRDRDRRARTDERGRFRVAGLDLGPYEVVFEHPSFGREVEPRVEADGPKDRKFQVQAAGWIEARVEGGTDDEASFGALVRLEPADPKAKGLRPRETKVLVRDRGFRLDKVKPGTWKVWLTWGDRITLPQTVEVGPGERSEVTLTFASGGSLFARFVDSEGRVVDPATLSIRPLDGGAGGGDLLARQGQVAANVMLPGRYEAVASAPGFLDVAVEPFTIAPGASHDLGTVRLLKRGFLKILSVVDESGRPPSTDVVLTVREGEKPPETRFVMQNGLIPVEPGKVEVRATAGERVFEQAFDVGEGETVDVRIVLAPR